MKEIKIIGEAQMILDDDEVVNPFILAEVDGEEIEDDFVEYADELQCYPKLIDGYTTFKVIDDNLYAICTYKLAEPLTKEDIEELIDYTQGQWSDGIGESFEQEPVMYIGDKEVYLSPWISKQQIEVKLID